MEMFLPNISLMVWSMLLLGLILLWLLVIRDLYKGSFHNPNERTLWLIIILFAPFLGSLIYLALGRKQKQNAQ